MFERSMDHIITGCFILVSICLGRGNWLRHKFRNRMTPACEPELVIEKINIPGRNQYQST